MRRSRLRQHIITLLGGRCQWCGTDDRRVLQIDHVYSDGAEERREYRHRIYQHILDDLESGRYQVLCASCNWIKQYEHGEHRRRFNTDDLPMIESELLLEDFNE